MAKKEETKVSEEEILEETVEEQDNTEETKGSEEAPKEAPDAVSDEAEAQKEESREDSPNEKKDKKDALIEELNDKLKRQMAEFENFRKRTEKEKAAMYDMGAVAVLERILPVIDNFERGLDSAGDDAFSEGMKMIYKQLMTSLDEMGVRLIPAVGETFDPELHNAVMHEENDEAGEGEITQELQKGYAYHDTVIRHSMVKVAN